MYTYTLRVSLLAAVTAVAAMGQSVPRRLTMAEAVQLAARENPDLQLARLRVLEAEAKTAQVKSAYQPQLAANISGTYQTINLQGIGLFIPGFSDRVGPFRTFNARPVLTQTVLDLSLLSRIRATKQRERTLEFDAATVREATLLAVVQVYLQVQQADSQATAARARLATATALLDQARMFHTAGTASKLDVARAEQTFHNETAAVRQAIRDRDLLQVSLLRLIGLAPEQAVELEPPTLASLAPGEGDDALRTALAERSELKSLDSTARAAAEEQRQAARERLPKIGFIADYGVSGAGPDRSLSTYNVGATLSIPLWTGRRIESEIRGARIRLDQVHAERRAAELRIAEEVTQARVDAGSSAETLKSAMSATAAAREALELARLRFSSGIAASVDVSIAQGTLAQAEDFEIRTRYAHQLALVRLAHARGNVNAFLDHR